VASLANGKLPNNFGGYMAGKLSKNGIAILASLGVGITMTILYFNENISLFFAIVFALIFSTISNYVILGREAFKDKYGMNKKKK
jgi:multisubunit Na+/H+ antiporter MnhG subunit